MKKMNLILEVIAALAMIPVVAVIRGLVVQKLYFWFVVPFGLPVLTLKIAIGLSILIPFLTYEIDFNKAKTKSLESREFFTNVISLGVFSPLLTLFIGFVVHSLG